MSSYTRKFEKFFDNGSTSETIGDDFAATFAESLRAGDNATKAVIARIRAAAPMFDVIAGKITAGAFSSRRRALLFARCAAELERGSTPLREYFAGHVETAFLGTTGTAAAQAALIEDLAAALEA